MRAAFLFFLTLFAFLQGSAPVAHGAAPARYVAAKTSSEAAFQSLYLPPTVRAAALPRPSAPLAFSIAVADDDESTDPQLEPVLRALGGFLSHLLGTPRYDCGTLTRPAPYAHSFLSTDRYIGLCTFRI